MSDGIDPKDLKYLRILENPLDYCYFGPKYAIPVFLRIASDKSIYLETGELVWSHTSYIEDESLIEDIVFKDNLDFKK